MLVQKPLRGLLANAQERYTLVNLKVWWSPKPVFQIDPKPCNQMLSRLGLVQRLLQNCPVAHISFQKEKKPRLCSSVQARKQRLKLERGLSLR